MEIYYVRVAIPYYSEGVCGKQTYKTNLTLKIDDTVVIYHGKQMLLTTGFVEHLLVDPELDADWIIQKVDFDDYSKKKKLEEKTDVKELTTDEKLNFLADKLAEIDSDFRFFRTEIKDLIIKNA